MCRSKMTHVKDSQKLRPHQKLSKRLQYDILNDRQVKVWEIAEAVGISEERVRTILHEELAMRKLCARWVPYFLNADPKQMRKRHSQQLVNPPKLNIFSPDLSWILHHDNAPAHTVLKISKFLQDHSTSVFPQPPYSSDLAPCNFFLFESSKKKLKGRKFLSIEEIKVESKKAMKAIPKTDYQRCFADWKKGG
ncbi:hypothetical protein LAZ67_17000668 [Cordylochernes scorpioides]|uniref:Transposase n=1 Tax=Cordylochernes scorpioides TaxID=51811 RepID=A0ABY6LH52_9ARAC|nr:hypothetical protein LAZ67_17000668 [Cordylochernes scorpioides]